MPLWRLAYSISIKIMELIESVQPHRHKECISIAILRLSPDVPGIAQEDAGQIGGQQAAS